MPKIVKNEKVIACACGHSQKGQAGVVKETVVARKSYDDVIEEGLDDSKLPIAKIECGKCLNKEAYFWTKQTRAGDEPETKFLKCTKCKHTWRDYS